MSELSPRRRRRASSSETKWEAALTAFARQPGRQAKDRNYKLEAAKAEVSRFTEAIKAQAIEFGLGAGKIFLGLNGPLPAGVNAEEHHLGAVTVSPGRAS